VKDLGVDVRIILEYILSRVGVCGLNSCGPVVCSCEHRKEPAGCTKGRKFHD
jgi:hypothetical protein